MARQRFTEVIDNFTRKAIPIGGEAKNITLEDGSVLEEALGPIKFQENGSIMDQMNNLKSKTLVKEYAPIQLPQFKKGISVKEDLISRATNSISESVTVKGIETTYLQNNKWRIEGTVTGNEEDFLVLFGGRDYDSNIGGAGDYSYKIKNSGCLIGEDIYLRFIQYSNSATSNEGTMTSVAIYEGDDLEGGFTVQPEFHLSRVDLLISSDMASQVLNGNIVIYLYAENDTINNNVFKISMNSDGTWQTTATDNLIVSSYKAETARSSLGTIYNSNWEGILNIKPDSTNAVGLTIENGGVGFKLGETPYYTTLKNITPYAIFTGYDNLSQPGLYYDSAVNHTFRTENNKIAFKITPEDISARLPFSVSSSLSVSGNTILEGDLVVNGTFKNTNVPISIYITDMATLEQIIADNTNYPTRKMININLGPAVCNYLITGKTGTTDWSAGGLAYKTSNTQMALWFVGNGKLYRTRYSWTGTGSSNRSVNTYSIDINTKEYSGTNLRKFI